MTPSRRLATALALAIALGGVAASSADAGVKTYTFKYGPIVVGRYDGVRGGNAVPAPRRTGFITAMDAHVVDEHDQVVPQSQVMLHHLVFKDLGRSGAPRPDGACPGSAGDQRFYGTSEELRALTLPKGYGYAIDRRDGWRMGWMLMNHTHETRPAWIRWRVTIDTARLRPVTPYWFSVMGCHVDPQFSVPGGGAGA